jgi:NAD-dependent deacetylase
MRITILTGAGISAESGIPTFRDHNGLWAGADPREVSSADALERDRWRVTDFYNDRREQILKAQPNAAHIALAELEKMPMAQCSIITQNIDNLHEKAGSRNVRHIHGEALKQRCLECNMVTSKYDDIDPGDTCPGCERIGMFRPHVVLFGEVPLDFDRARHEVAHSDLFVSIGTSGQVYPASELVRVALGAGAVTISLNLDGQDESPLFKYSLHGPATQTVPRLVDTLQNSLFDLSAVCLQLEKQERCYEGEQYGK